MEKPLVVYTIVTRERDGRKLWIRIGSAFRDRDGQINVVLDAVPTNGTLVIREATSERALPAPESVPDGTVMVEKGGA